MKEKRKQTEKTLKKCGTERQKIRRWGKNKTKTKEKDSSKKEDGECREAVRLISTPPFPPLLSSPWNGSLKSLD